MAKVTHKEVIDFFKTADRDLAELTLEIANTAVDARIAVSEKISTNLKKARAARKPKGSTQAAAATTTESVPAPPTIGSTGVESDQEFASSARG